MKNCEEYSKELDDILDLIFKLAELGYSGKGLRFKTFCGEESELWDYLKIIEKERYQFKVNKLIKEKKEEEEESNGNNV